MGSVCRRLFSLCLVCSVLYRGHSEVRKITRRTAYGDSGGQQQPLDIEAYTYPERVETPVGFNLNLSSLEMSTILFCQLSRCIPCVRVHIRMNNSVPVIIDGVQIHFFEYKSNRNSEIQVRWRNYMPPVNTANFIYECFESDAGSKVEVGVKTIPDYGYQLTEEYNVEDYETGSQMNYSVILKKKQILVTAPLGRVLKAMLCYKRGLVCRELKNSSILLINSTFSLSYEYLLPCLCVQVFYPGPDSSRTTICPFTNTLEAFGPDLWRSTNFSDLIHHRNSMAVRLTGKCHIKPSVVLCWKSNGICEEFEESAAKISKSGYVFESVDRHSQMCFKFKYKNSSHIECRNRRDADWNVTMVTESNQLLLSFASHIPASFSAVLCKMKEDECKNQTLIHNVTQTEFSTQKLLMVLSVESHKFCVRVWRSDVVFSGKQLLCPQYSRNRLGLGLLSTLVLLAAMPMLVYMVWKFATEVSAPLWSRTVLMMYSPDSEDQKKLICAFADVLKTEVHCNIILDLWDTGRVAEIGIVSWLYSKRELVEREGGKIIIIWSKRSQEMYNQWSMLDSGSKMNHNDLHDLFNTSMACVYNDILRNRRIKDYSIIYFDGLCNKENIPAIFTKIPKYRMLKDFSSLVHALQSAPKFPCGLELGAKFLVHKILRSEKMQTLRNQIEQFTKLQRHGLLCCEESDCSD
ncbi:interleukin-17 receptor E-like [Hemiscyllium ocellatum]|uniref:interleukin-17 receptor E-like n=1 Tax=Hemiscyllium ocellatum TaxID=170820 RepID=UPI0029674667|nr:interleukin-17 receptor E-like [Hemiscyllium ocellatum]